MAVTTVTHLNFRGDARAALSFYHVVFGGEVMLVSYRDAGDLQAPDEADQVMWGQVMAPSGFRVMAYDVPARMAWQPGERAFFVALRGDTVAEIESYWAKLSEQATVLQPLGPAAWSQLYGMLTDRFGITWVIDVAAPEA